MGDFRPKSCRCNSITTGTSATDLTNYYTKAEVDGKLLLKANDSDVVHKSGDETVGGKKTFTNEITNNINKTNATITLKNSSYDPKTNGQSNVNSGSFSIGFNTLTDDSFAWISAYGLTDYTMLRLTTTYFTDSENSITDSIEYKIYQNGDRTLRPRNNNNTTLGETNRRWSKIYGTEYYYGSNNVEFSTKFVTTDTAQTVSGGKTFSDNLTIYNSDDTVTPKGLAIRNAQWVMGESGATTVSNISFLDKNSSIPVSIMASKGLSGQSYLRFSVRTRDSQNNTYSEELYYDIDTSGNVEFRSWHDNIISLGTSAYKWKDVQTYKVNALEPSSLSLPDLSNGIDISSYIDVSQTSTNYYTPPANGWISISVITPIRDSIQIECSGGFRSSVYSATNPDSTSEYIASIIVPCIKNDTVTIYFKTSRGGTIKYAKFFPCLGNV